MHKICGQSLCIITHCAKCRISGCRPAEILCIFSLDKCCRLCYTETTRARTVRASPKIKRSDRKSPTLYYNMKSKSCQGFFNFICCTANSSSVLNVTCHPPHNLRACIWGSMRACVPVLAHPQSCC
jgi:hypothetical protein